MSKGWKYGIGLGVVILLLFAGNLLVGSVSIPPADVFRILLGGEGEKASWSFILWESRLPQALTALLCGGALAVCGLMLQTAFKNPLAGPSILGINAGASLGVAFVMLLFGGSITAGVFSLSGFFSVLLGAFIGAMLIMVLILFFSTLIKSNIMLLITGIMIGYIASSAIALLNFFATAEGVQSYMIWGPVSYTHLDVYKRQGWGDKQVAQQFAGMSFPYKIYFHQCLQCTLPARMAHGHGSVSYTHLAQAGPDMNAGQQGGAQDNTKHGDNVQDADFEEVK